MAQIWRMSEESSEFYGVAEAVHSLAHQPAKALLSAGCTKYAVQLVCGPLLPLLLLVRANHREEQKWSHTESWSETLKTMKSVCCSINGTSVLFMLNFFVLQYSHSQWLWTCHHSSDTFHRCIIGLLENCKGALSPSVQPELFTQVGHVCRTIKPASRDKVTG